METNQENPKQIPSSQDAKQSFLQKNMVGVIAFILLLLYSLIRSGNFGSMIIDIPLSLLIAVVIQLIFIGLKKIFSN